MCYAMYYPWFVFLISALLIYVSGTRLSASAEKIAKETGLGSLWVGMILLSLATSLPELIASWRAVNIGAPDLAVGNLLGSNLFNLGIIALIDLVQGKGAIFNNISRNGHKTTTIFIILMTFMVIAGFNIPWHFAGISPVTPFLFMTYLAVAYLLRQGKNDKKSGEASPVSRKPLYKALLSFTLSSGVIVLAAIKLADAAEALAEITGWGYTFVGSMFLALSTSLPEIVTATAAAKMGAFDLAVGSVLGSNLTNLAILFPVDIFYYQGPLLFFLSPLHLVTAAMGILLALLVYLGLVRPSSIVLGDIGLNSLFILVGYIASMVILFVLGAGI